MARIDPRAGVLLELARIQQGMSLRGAAKAAGISAPYLYRIEQGQRRPSATVARELSRVLRLGERDRAVLAIQAGAPDLA